MTTAEFLAGYKSAKAEWEAAQAELVEHLENEPFEMTWAYSIKLDSLRRIMREKWSAFNGYKSEMPNKLKKFIDL